jgi:RimJ/RimL family protein N-acetyltransferase
MLGTHFYIAEVGGEPVGTVRFKNNRISVNCDKEYRNNGIGTEIIKQSLKMVRDIGLIQAYIKKTNKQSIKAFGKAGFTRMGDTVYKETPTVIMEINLEEKIDNGLHTTGK